MKFLKSLLMGTGGVVLAGLVLALLAPKAVHAVVATAVQVVNTSASPAITEDTSRQAAQIVTILCSLNTSIPLACNQILPNGVSVGTSGVYGGFVVPPNQFFVLKGISTGAISAATPMDVVFYHAGVSGFPERVAAQPYSQVSFSSGIVAGPGVEIYPRPTSSISGYITLHGYLTAN